MLYISFTAERAAVCRTLEDTPPAELKKLFSGGGRQGLWARLTNPTFLFLTIAPRGWLYQNMCTVAVRGGLFRASFDIANDQVLPDQFDGIGTQLRSAMGHFAPYTFLGAEAVPDFLKASQRMPRNQTLANEAFIACALERYRLAHGKYPGTLDELVPQFAAKLPNDIIGGQPLKYERSADDRFDLYSVGWNGKDDGGVPGKTLADGDWVW